MFMTPHNAVAGELGCAAAGGFTLGISFNVAFNKKVPPH